MEMTGYVKSFRSKWANPIFRNLLEAAIWGWLCESAAWINGRHTRGAGFIKDMEKYNAATLLGWRLLRYTPEQVKSGMASTQIRQMMEFLACNGE